jgi:excisionase family DNA binding protein
MDKITANHLARQAFVYIRQSTPGQVQHNVESKRRQYALVDRARELGWPEATIIDDDLGRSGDGVYRPGFERLCVAMCEGIIGAVFCVEASRLARNGRDWQTLLEFCRLVNCLLIDHEDIYDPKQCNDRLLLGMKGHIAEIELSTLLERSQTALAQKAKRGELFRLVAVGYVRTEKDKIEKDPDERVCAAIDLVFRKFAEFASVRQLYYWLCDQQIKMPAFSGAGRERHIEWKRPRYHSLLSLLKNPVYAGAYAYGRSKADIRIVDGRKRIVQKKNRRQEEWTVLIPDHHESYINWDVYKSNQALIADNANMMSNMVRGSVRSGGALLAGLLRCGDCGAKILANYPKKTVHRYQCSGYILNRETSCCIGFGGMCADRMVVEQALECLKPLGIQAAIQAIENLQGDSDERLRHKALALQQARYEVTHAQRQYDAVDPTNRLVAAELERRWNEALKIQTQLEEELNAVQRVQPIPLSDAMKAELLALADDLPQLWDHPNSPFEFKKRVLRTMLKEIIATANGNQVRLVLHWQGGVHTELTLEKARTGQHRYSTGVETVDLVRSLARIQPDAMIASVLNRLGHRSAHGKSWNAKRVCSLRSYREIEVYREGERQLRGEMTVSEVATLLQVGETTVRRMIRQKHLPATQACNKAPWILLKTDVEQYVAARGRRASPQPTNCKQMALDIQ